METVCVAAVVENIGGSRQRAAAVTTYGFALVVTAGYACLCRLRHGRNEREVFRTICAKPDGVAMGIALPKPLPSLRAGHIHHTGRPVEERECVPNPIVKLRPCLFIIGCRAIDLDHPEAIIAAPFKERRRDHDRAPAQDARPYWSDFIVRTQACKHENRHICRRRYSIPEALVTWLCGEEFWLRTFWIIGGHWGFPWQRCDGRKNRSFCVGYGDGVCLLTLANRPIYAA